MRIGAFSKAFNCSIDTVRYYISLQLLRPKRKGRYFVFGHEEKEVMKVILQYKALGLTLDEIKYLLYVKKLDPLTLASQKKGAKKIFEERRKAVHQEMEALKKISDDLDHLIEETSQLPSLSKEEGMPLEFLSLLTCPRCNESLVLEEGILASNRILSGHGRCSCGYELSLEEGILHCSPGGQVINPITQEEEEPFAKTPKSFVDYMFTAMDLLQEAGLDRERKGGLVLDLKSGVGLFILTFLEKAPVYKQVVLLEDDVDKLKIAKSSIQAKYPEAKVLYVVGEVKDLPLPRKSVDIVFDFTASLVNSFRGQLSTYEDLVPYLGQESALNALLFHFKKLTMLERLPKEMRPSFTLNHYEEIMKKNGFFSKELMKDHTLHEGENLASFFQPGDQVVASLRKFYR